MVLIKILGFEMTDTLSLTKQHENLDAYQKEDEDNNNEFAMHLKPVFDACDYSGDGFVRIQDLIDLGKQHSVGNSGEELESILKELDDSGNGTISFDEFCFKVQQLLEQDDDIQPSPRDRINSLEVKLPPRRATVGSDPLREIPEKSLFELENAERPRSDSDSYIEDFETASHPSTTSMNDVIGEFDNLKNSSPIKNGQHHAPPNSYFAQRKRNSSIYSTYPPNGRFPKRERKNIYNLQHRQLSRTSEYQSQETGFEAFGEGDDWGDSSVISEPTPDPALLSPHNSRYLLRRPSGTHVANRLVQSARTSLHGSDEEIKHSYHRHSFSEADVDGDFLYLSDEIKKLSSQISLMKMDQDDHDDKQKRLKEENKMLLNKINALEEQLHDQKVTSKQTVETETQKYRKELQKVQRDQTENLDRLQIKLHETESEIDNLKTVEPMLRKEIESSLEERRLAQKKVDDLQGEIIDKEREIEQFKYKLQSKIDELEREKRERAEEIMVLTQEIDNLKYMKNAALNQFDERNDLLMQMEMIKKENNNLRTAQDDLRNQMIQQNTMIEMEKQHTLADELQTADKGDVLDALRTEENENHRLRQYIDQLLILIMQSDPLLLEK